MRIKLNNEHLNADDKCQDVSNLDGDQSASHQHPVNDDKCRDADRSVSNRKRQDI